jgi:hypothetical protein
MMHVLHSCRMWRLFVCSSTFRCLQQTLFEGRFDKSGLGHCFTSQKKVVMVVPKQGQLPLVEAPKHHAKPTGETFLVPPTPLHSKHQARVPMCSHLSHIKSCFFERPFLTLLWHSNLLDRFCTLGPNVSVKTCP